MGQDQSSGGDPNHYPYHNASFNKPPLSITLRNQDNENTSRSLPKQATDEWSEGKKLLQRAAKNYLGHPELYSSFENDEKGHKLNKRMNMLLNGV